MSAQANITVFDGAATPVTHTLVALGTGVASDTYIADWRESNVSLPMAAQIRCQTRSRKLKNDVLHVQVSAVVPVMESISGQNAAGYTAAPKVAYENTVVVNGYFNARATPAERRLVRQLAINLLGSVSTSVAPVTTGPMPELIDLGVNVS